MSEYSNLENFLASVMSIETGLSEEQEQAAIDASLRKSPLRKILKLELDAALNDKNMSWIRLLENEKYCVMPAETEDDARNYVLTKIFNKIISIEADEN